MKAFFVPTISRIPGFVALYLLDAGGGAMISTSIFLYEDPVPCTKKAWIKTDSPGFAKSGSGRKCAVWVAQS